MYTASIRELHRSRWLFGGLCCYLLAQSFTIPIRAIGPWAMWPTLGDLSVLLLVAAFGLSFPLGTAMSQANRRILTLLLVIWGGCVLSYLGYLAGATGELSGVRLGQYQIYRLTQTIILFAITARIPLNQARLKTLHHLITGVLLFNCVMILLTFAGVVPLPMLTAHLPQGNDAAGPWSFFTSIAKYGNKGWGTLGYNHAYNSAQIILLLGFKLHLGVASQARQQQISLIFTLLLSLVTCFVTESRAGFAACFVLVLLYLLKKPTALVQTGVLLLCVLTLAFTLMPSFDASRLESAEGSIVERQTKLLEANDTENLSGRDDLWGQKFRYLDAQPQRWLIGGGFGCAWDSSESGESAHMLPLQVVLETGVLGFCVFSLLFGKILTSLYRQENQQRSLPYQRTTLHGTSPTGLASAALAPGWTSSHSRLNSSNSSFQPPALTSSPNQRPFFWVTLVLLFASSTQETFYPVPAMIGFMSFYACSLAIALRPPIQDSSLQDSSLQDSSLQQLGFALEPSSPGVLEHQCVEQPGNCASHQPRHSNSPNHKSNFPNYRSASAQKSKRAIQGRLTPESSQARSSQVISTKQISTPSISSQPISTPSISSQPIAAKPSPAQARESAALATANHSAALPWLKFLDASLDLEPQSD